MDSTTDDDLLLERQLCFALSVASRSVVGAYRPVLEKLDLTHPQYLVMLVLWERSPRTVRSIGSALAMESATLSPMLKRLEAMGLLTRTRVPGNERALAVDLTAAGRQLRSRALEVPVTMLKRLGLTREQVDTLNEAMHAIIRATGTELPASTRPEHQP
ncbi:DNA-binding MarR family transcriptional regulator [Arthrobacter sp. PL16]|uniref:MarR family transcriptional regulator n=1 Tax=Arthrobacter cheniae TaxID=1258888 RepID=A0A3A5M8E1_9MICC|nr:MULTISPECIES: MarR family transcriptional regulator [Arthrobacter]MEC5198639.1 DNA-binding MarR family transcriptional regulator [Arthrobacter sp. PL16]RJT83402.1 MarR family transcriptional regulator [Arthrobacter cheniae]